MSKPKTELQSELASEFKIEIPRFANPTDIVFFFEAFQGDNLKGTSESVMQGSSSRNFFFLRDEKNVIRGGAYAQFAFDLVYIDSIWVAADLRGQGHGARLYRAVEDLAYIGKKKRAVLSTFAFQNALLFWERMGFETFAELPGSSTDSRLIYMHKAITENSVSSEGRQKL